MHQLTFLDPASTINDVVARYPATMSVFNRFGMDTCCGGGLAVRDAVARHGLDLDEVLTALREVVEQA